MLITQDEFSVEIDYFVNCFHKRDGDSLYLVGGDNRYLLVYNAACNRTAWVIIVATTCTQWWT